MSLFVRLEVAVIHEHLSGGNHITADFLMADSRSRDSRCRDALQETSRPTVVVTLP